MTHDYEGVLSRIDYYERELQSIEDNYDVGEKIHQDAKAIKSALQLAMDSGWREIDTLPDPMNRPGRYWAKFTGFEEHSGRLWNRVHSAVVYSNPLEPFGVSPDDLALVKKQGCFDGIDAITHWRPLPQPPEASE